jgi:hypothetical protein
MAGYSKNVFFGNYKSSREQELLNSLIQESIAIYGEDMWFIPRVINNYDEVYGADDQSSYEQAFLVPIYIESVAGFGGDGTFMAKFGIEVRDRITLSISQTVFNQEIGTTTGQVRPNEGDLIYFPLNEKCFQIKYVNKFEMFYPLGALYVWQMQCELFEYSGETMSTGIEAIDSLQTSYNTDIMDWGVTTDDLRYLYTEDGFLITIDGSDVGSILPMDDSDEIQNESDDFIDFSVLDPFSSGKI